MKLSDISELTKEDVLRKLGLTTVPSFSERLLGWAGVFGLGIVAGAGVMLLFAPKAGEEFRQDLGRRWRNYREEANEALNEAIYRVA